MLASCSTVRLAAAGPSFLNAALVGAKMVKSWVQLTSATRSAVAKAETRSVNPSNVAVSETSDGTVKTVSMTWMMPPSNWISWEF